MRIAVPPCSCISHKMPSVRKRERLSPPAAGGVDFHGSFPVTPSSSGNANPPPSGWICVEGHRSQPIKADTHLHQQIATTRSPRHRTCISKPLRLAWTFIYSNRHFKVVWAPRCRALSKQQSEPFPQSTEETANAIDALKLCNPCRWERRMKKVRKN